MAEAEEEDEPPLPLVMADGISLPGTSLAAALPLPSTQLLQPAPTPNAADVSLHPSSPSALLDLPDELLALVASFLALTDAVGLRRVCSRLRALLPELLPRGLYADAEAQEMALGDVPSAVSDPVQAALTRRWLAVGAITLVVSQLDDLRPAVLAAAGLDPISVHHARLLAFDETDEYEQVLSHNSTLHSLCLRSDFHTARNLRDAGAQRMARVLRSNSTLRSLRLEHCKIGPAGLAELTAALAAAKLRKLSLVGNKADSMAPLMATVLGANVLRELNLSCNVLQQADLEAILRALGQGCRLAALLLDQCALFNIPSVKHKLSLCLRNNAHLTRLSLRLNALTQPAFFAPGLASNKHLRVLDLYANLLGDAGTEVLAEALVAHPTLSVLNLGDNGVGDAGAAALARVLAAPTTALRELRLAKNQIACSGAAALASALAFNLSLGTLDLCFNRLGLGGAEALAGSLVANARLQSLNLEANAIGDEGVCALAAALQCNAALRSLDLSRCQVGDRGAAALAALLRAAGRAAAAWSPTGSSALAVLDLESNRVGARAAAELRSAALVGGVRVRLWNNSNTY